MNIIDGSQNNYTYDYSHTDGGNSMNLDNTATTNIENMERNSRGML